MRATKNVIEHLKANMYQPVKVDELADIACLSKVQLYRVFTSEIGVTPIQYHELLRIKKGIELLQSDIQIRQVAYQLGYENYETFSRAFKKIVTLAPSDLQSVYFQFIEQANPNCALIIKEQASLIQIDNLINESFGDKRYDLDVEIYRLNFQTKKKWDLLRDLQSENALKRIKR
ncbi:helix-turn-helix domain-containing protein [Aquimarina algicola]|uniref:Helix-turn-helix domain-containing protein n=1 Tax=Aquimarina algicola TaxID=2589995 RepID=A0A504J8J7_9FLAO|nr:helix-turn-helix domain-containing protein [Aquimarina algicola]TPN86904.1 helix-turn-helix domain-containing protein [Aquimarina algicola]